MLRWASGRRESLALMHKGLLSQLRRSFGVSDAAEAEALCAAARASGDAAPELVPLLRGFPDFLARIEAAFEQFDRDLDLRSRSLELSSTELTEANNRLREELASRERALAALRELVAGLMPAGTAQNQVGQTDLEEISTLLSWLVADREADRRALDNQKFALDQHAIVSITDTRGTILYANDKFCEISGYAREELLGQNHRMVKSAVHPPAFFAELWETIRRGEVWHGEVCNRAKDGHLYWVSATIAPLLGADGRPEQYIAIRTDITARKVAEQRVGEQLHLMEEMLEAIPLPVYIKDREGRYLRLNRAFEAFFHVRREDYVGRTLHDLLPPEDARVHAERDEALFSHPGTQTYEASVHSRDGGRHDAIYRKATLTRPDGSVFGLLGAIIDITERKAGEAALKEAKESAESANRAKSQFLANMSHEIRTPMNGIIGMTDLALDTALDDEQREYLGIVRSSADALLALINDILDFSKIEAGKLLIETIPFDLHQVTRETLKPLAVRALEKKLELICDIAADVPQHVLGDPGRLRQVLVNLVGNAIKFTAQGEIAVELRRSDDGLIHLAVRDTGIGIPRDKQGQIFEAFTQEDSSTTRRYGGTGLGLSICSRLAELMGGRLWLDSAVGVGSTFHFALALTENPEGPPPLAPPAVLRGRRALLVDDNATNRRVLSTLLGRWGLHCTSAHDGREALALIAAPESFDVLIVDAHMPEMDGYALALAVHERFSVAAPPVLLLTSGACRGDAQRCRECGVAAYFPKPVAPADLAGALARVLAAQAAAAPREPALVTRHSLREGGRPLDILLVEDHPINQKLATSLLEKWGHRVTVAGHGGEALTMIETGRRFDLVLMDMQMPVMGGLEATERIRCMETERGLPRVPIVAMTANAMQSDRDACIAAGMDDYIAKPVRATDLAAMLATRGGVAPE